MKEQIEVVSVQFGDVVEMLFREGPRRFSWDEPRVVTDVKKWSLGTAGIVERNGNTYLTTTGTAEGPLRLAKGIGRWTLDEVVRAATAGLGVDAESEHYKAIRAIYTRDAAVGPVQYHFRWPEGSESMRGT